jgi:DNA (cytosine-5)-methyltransferase 1
MTYYNEHDSKCAQWLRELMNAGLIPLGVVDERSIVDVKPYEISEFKQQHFFAGIGGWAYALRLAGWPDERPVRTGSCPCQPYSRATKGKGDQDKRNLWPVFRDIIAFGEHAVTFGEQVASDAGRKWLSGIRADMEALGYEFGAADLCAACVGSPPDPPASFLGGFPQEWE